MEFIRARVPVELKKRVEHASVDLGKTVQQFLVESLELRLALFEGGKPALDRAVKALEQKG